jgi:hypothetical protein
MVTAELVDGKLVSFRLTRTVQDRHGHEVSGEDGEQEKPS